MLRLFFLAITAVVLVAVGYVILPRRAVRPDAHLDTPAVAAPADPTSFTVHDAPPAPLPAPPPPGVAASGGDLDAVMQRLRAAAPQRMDPPPANGLTPLTPLAAPPVAPVPPVITPTPPAASRWTSVTPQGARWRMAPGADGYVISIDIGGNRVASVHVAPAFSNLDPAAINQRVDYLKQTILQNFPPETASYIFGRDGSVSLER